jgi:hypothetical protein
MLKYIQNPLAPHSVPINTYAVSAFAFFMLALFPNKCCLSQREEWGIEMTIVHLNSIMGFISYFSALNVVLLGVCTQLV